MIFYTFQTNLGWHWVEEGRGVEDVAGPYIDQEACENGAKEWAAERGIYDLELLPHP